MHLGAAAFITPFAGSGEGLCGGKLPIYRDLNVAVHLADLINVNTLIGCIVQQQVIQTDPIHDI